MLRGIYPQPADSHVQLLEHVPWLDLIVKRVGRFVLELRFSGSCGLVFLALVVASEANVQRCSMRDERRGVSAYENSSGVDIGEIT